MTNDLNYTNFLLSQINEILLNAWDPIGVRCIPEAQDEYRFYVYPVYDLLMSERPETDIFDYLWLIETEHMGLNGDKIKTKSIANRLRNLRSKD